MLLFNRKIGERIVIGEDVVVTVVKVQGSQVRLGIEAPLSVSIRKGLLPLDPSDDVAAPRQRLYPVEAGS